MMRLLKSARGRRRFSLFLLLVSLLLPSFPLPVPAGEDEFVVGVFPRRDAKRTVTMFSPLCRYLEENLGRPVRLVTTKDFASFWKRVEGREFDLVHFNQLHYVEAHDAFGYVVVVGNEEFGRKTLAGALYVRKDSGITDLAQLKGRKVVFGGGKKAMMSYVVPRYLLLKAGIGKGDLIEEFAVNPPNAVLAVYYRQADGGGGGDVVIDLPQVRKRIDADALTILARSEPILGLPWAVSGAMPAETRKRIRALLLALNDSDTGKEILTEAGLTGFVPASDADFEPHRHYIKAVFGQ